jgi:hypothetical protein
MLLKPMMVLDHKIELPFQPFEVKFKENVMGQHHHTHHNEENSARMPFATRAEKLIGHWIQHNEDHGQSYRQWALQFRQNHLEKAAAALDSVAELSDQIDRMLRKAADHIAASASQSDAPK